jgi:hypothetical protein
MDGREVSAARRHVAIPHSRGVPKDREGSYFPFGRRPFPSSSRILCSINSKTRSVTDFSPTAAAIFRRKKVERGILRMFKASFDHSSGQTIRTP